MRKSMFVFSLLALASMLSAAADKFAGKWKMNSAKSTGDDLPKAEMLVIEDQGDKVQVTIAGTAADGTPIAIKYVVPASGGTGQVTQGPYNGVSETNVNDSTRDVTYSKDGKAVSTGREVVSSDGKTISVTNTGHDSDGKSVSNTEVYQKQ
jgi:hypothetical protein